MMQLFARTFENPKGAALGAMAKPPLSGRPGRLGIRTHLYLGFEQNHQTAHVDDK